MAVKLQPGSELARLWTDAFQAYNDAVGAKGFKLSLDGSHLVTRLSDVVQSVDTSQKSFQKWRNNGGNWDKAVHFIGKNLDYAQRIGDQVAGSATAAFPPACAIWTVATYAIKACQSQSKDYDQLLSLIGEAGSFLKTLQIIEDNFPNSKCYAECVTDAFTAIIVVFAIQTKFMWEGRPLKFLHTLVQGGGDARLSAAYDDVTTAISRLSRANGLMAVRNTEDIKTLMGRFDEKVDFMHDEMLVYFKDQGQQIEDGFKQQDLNFQQQHASLASIKQSIKELRNQLAQANNTEGDTQPTTDVVARKSMALDIAQQFFGTPPSPLAKFEEIRRSFVPGTDTWLYEDKRYQEWQTGEANFLWITGEPGLGKTHLAYSIIESLRSNLRNSPQASIVYYFFQESNEPFRSVKAALRSIGLQIVNQNHYLRERLASVTSDVCCATWSLFNIWQWAIDFQYKDNPNNELVIIIDSLEQANHGEANELLAYMEGIVTSKVKIKVVFTGNDYKFLCDWRKYRVTKEIITITIDPTIAQSGVKKLLDSRFESLPRLSRFSDYAKAKIAKAMQDSKYGLQYTDRILQYLDSKGLERPAMRALDELPEDLPRFYNNVLTTCSGNLKDNERPLLKLLFSWIAVTERPLNLEEVYSLLKLKHGRSIDLETEIVGRCSSILDMSSTLVWEERIREMQRKAIVQKDSTLENQSDDVANVPRQDMYQPDGSLLVHFQDNTLREHMRQADPSCSTLQTPPLQSHVDIFSTCVEVLCTSEKPEALENTDEKHKLQKYAANYWVAHLKRIIDIGTSEDDSPQGKVYTVSASDELVTQVIECLSTISSNTNDVANKLSQHGKGACYEDFNDPAMPYFIMLWVQKALESSQSLLSEQARLWAEAIVQNPAQILQPLARGHVLHWLAEIHQDSALRAFELAWKAFVIRDLPVGPPEEDEDDSWFYKENDNFSESDDDSSEEDDMPSREERLISAFQDIKVGPSGYRAMGLTLLSEWPDEALEMFSKSLELCETDVDQFATLSIMADCLMRADDLDGDTYDIACNALTIDRSSLGKEHDDLLHAALIVKATYESNNNMLEAAVKSLEEAMAVYSGDQRKTAEDFSMLLRTLDKLCRHEDILTKIVEWGPMRLAVTAEDWDEVNLWYQKAAKQTGQEQVMMATYELLVQELAPLGWASPTRYQYALGCRRSIGDMTKAKSLLYEIIDADNCIDPANDTISDRIPYLARRELSEMIYEEFVQTTSSSEKRALLTECEGLAERKLGNAHLTADQQSNYLKRPEATILARMYRRFGPLDKFEEVLTEAFDNCLVSLKDRNPWNDSDTLRELCNILACLPGLQREAAIALSAQFYHLDKDLMAKSLDFISRKKESDEGIGLENGSDGAWEDTDDDGEVHDSVDEVVNVNRRVSGNKDRIRALLDDQTVDGYDITDHRGIRCGGYCLDNPGDITSWNRTAMYRCVICTDCDWCEACYSKRTGNGNILDGERWRTYCGASHEFVRAPVKGWMGIKDGKIVIQGEEPVKFQDWLGLLEKSKWPKAWEEFWKG
ncbi:vegetative incompatibility het-e-1 [Fusarium longipes]|uniref:Vegetative incompatibility het-e-1 n=1 Tax=Fusarium longipes TaxID=694270 RepID=A0A395RWB9_9HYPO|nr:vegetative incompatibility het-e-1 [Fusarium longipes]